MKYLNIFFYVFIFVNILFFFYVNNIHRPISTNDLKSIKESLIEISSKEYVLNVYDCSEFSRDLYKSLKEKNISSTLIIGYNGGVHCWVEININNTMFILESTNGNIYPYNETGYFRIIKGFCF